MRKASYKKWAPRQKRQEPIIEAREKEEMGIRIAADAALRGLEEAKWKAVRKVYYLDRTRLSTAVALMNVVRRTPAVYLARC